MIVVACAVIVPCWPTTTRGQGTLQNLRSAVRNKSTGSKNDDDHRHNKSEGHHYHHDSDGSSWFSGHDDDDGEESFNEFVCGIALLTVSSPFWIPRTAMSDDGWDAGYFTRYPYRGKGFMVTRPTEDEERYAWLARVRAEYADDFDRLSRVGGQVLLDTWTRYGLDTEFDRRQEKLGIGQYDYLWTGDCNVVVRFAQSNYGQMRSGLGFNWIADDLGSDFGFNFTYGGDFFPREPWIFSADIDWGRLGGTSLFHGRVTAGIHWHRLEVYTGYDYYDVSRVGISGFVSGVRMWF